MRMISEIPRRLLSGCCDRKLRSSTEYELQRSARPPIRHAGRRTAPRRRMGMDTGVRRYDGSLIQFIADIDLRLLSEESDKGFRRGPGRMSYAPCQISFEKFRIFCVLCGQCFSCRFSYSPYSALALSVRILRLTSAERSLRSLNILIASTSLEVSM